MNFYKDISDVYEYIFPYKQAQKDFVQSYSNIDNRSSGLDIGCGIGDLSLKVAKNVNKLSAIDLNSSMIDRAKRKNPAENLNYFSIDMMNCEQEFGHESFDIIYSFGNTLVHLLSQEKIEIFLSGINKTLKKEGKLLLQILNYEHIMNKEISSLPLIENEKIRFKRSYSKREDGLLNFETKLLIKEKGQELQNSIPLFPIKKKELNKLLIKTSFREINYYSNFKGEPYKSDSLPLILSCKK